MTDVFYGAFSYAEWNTYRYPNVWIGSRHKDVNCPVPPRTIRFTTAVYARKLICRPCLASAQHRALRGDGRRPVIYNSETDCR